MTSLKKFGLGHANCECFLLSLKMPLAHHLSASTDSDKCQNSSPFLFVPLRSPRASFLWRLIFSHLQHQLASSMILIYWFIDRLDWFSLSLLNTRETTLSILKESQPIARQCSSVDASHSIYQPASASWDDLLLPALLFHRTLYFCVMSACMHRTTPFLPLLPLRRWYDSDSSADFLPVLLFHHQHDGTI